jgi:hypothetical protein
MNRKDKLEIESRDDNIAVAFMLLGVFVMLVGIGICCGSGSKELPIALIIGGVGMLALGERNLSYHQRGNFF